ncbi:Amidohydrolase [Paracoccus halophilus]|uniref:Amidohydrolase n=1 Tax=Paracoccus halophilus TaxID=376733 RepID=A0A099F043_9RHOB|nr:amidohydrolase family protein [Paracoccus halophilus]KGJ03623.1 hypothetical protein IT41_13495 [Paracoccus halophilus]SFA58015.1 Amidohydrolase [Paracoccus halophilus]
MLDRRLFLGGMAGILSGCVPRPPSLPVPYPLDLGIDAHAHVFNGRDVPAIGFLEQVVFGPEGTPLPGGVPLKSLIRLLVNILRIGTPSAAAEAAGIRARTVADDQKSVARGIDEFRGAGAAARMAGTGGTSDEDALLLEMIRAEASGEPMPEPRAMAARRIAPAAQPDGETLAALIYRGPTASAMRAAPGARQGALRPGRLIPTIQWAALLTRGRGDLITEMIRLYGGDGGKRMRVFVTSLVDLEYWLNSESSDGGWLSGPDDQIAVMSALARARKDTLILNFAPFCPLRAVIDGPGTLQRVQDAVRNQGFAGVKLYPPMGFRATCNDGISFAHSRFPAGVTGAQIDRELNRLYAWCADEEVPIQAHANNSMAAGNGTGLYSAPVYWQRVLQRFASLRLNLSHAGHLGGISDTRPVPTRCGIAFRRDWLAVIADMIRAGQQVWFDTGYWNEVALDSTDRPTAVGRLRALAGTGEDRARFLGRMLYGSDWTMVAREPGFNAYLAGMQEFLREVIPDAAEFDAVMGGNASRFLLGPGRKRHDALGRFFVDNAVWRSHFAG